MIKRLLKLIKKIRDEEAKHKLADQMLNDPLSIELLAKVAKNCSRHFDVVRPDGTIFRFHDTANFNPGIEPDKGKYW